jgi:hypothetical protein
MKKVAFLATIGLGLFMGACCSVEQRAIAQLEANDKLVIPAYLKYVDADASLKADEKADRHKLVESRQQLLEAIKNSAK